MKTVYIAYDGTQFDNSSDCKKYEENKRMSELKANATIKIPHKKITIFNESGGFEAELFCLSQVEQLDSFELLLNTMDSHYSGTFHCIAESVKGKFIRDGNKKLFFAVWFDYNTDYCPIEYSYLDDILEGAEDIKEYLKTSLISIDNAVKELGGDIGGQ